MSAQSFDFQGQSCSQQNGLQVFHLPMISSGEQPLGETKSLAIDRVTATLYGDSTHSTFVPRRQNQGFEANR